MRTTRQLIGGIILGVAIVAAIAGTTYDGGLGRFYGDTVLTNLQTGAVYFNTSNSTFWAGGSSSNPVKVGDASWSNNVTASVTNGLPDTNYVNNAVAGYLPTNTVFGITTNLSVLDLSTNSLTLYFTNGLLKGATSP